MVDYQNTRRTDPLMWAAYLIVLAIIILYTVTRIFPSKTEFVVTAPANQTFKVENDSLVAILLQKDINNLKEQLIQTRADIVKMNENTAATSRDVMGLITFIIGLISIAGIYKIRSIKDELTSDIKLQIEASLAKLSAETTEGIEQIRSHQEYFEHIREMRSDNPSRIARAADYFYGQHQTYRYDPYVIAGFQRALSAISDHQLESKLRRILVMLNDPVALDGLLQRFSDLTGEAKFSYKLALRGLVKDGFQQVEERLKKEGLLEQIMS